MSWKKAHSKGIILSFPDKTKGKRDNWKSCKKGYSKRNQKMKLIPKTGTKL